MRQSLLGSAVACGTLFVSVACGVNFDRQAYIERDEKRFPADGKVELRLDTFDGAMEIRAWDRPEVVVQIEKRGADKEAVSKIVVTAEQKGNQIEVVAKNPTSKPAFGFGGFSSPTAKFIVNAPKKIDLFVHTGDGSILVERIDGKISLQSGDGSIKAIETAGELTAESGDGSIDVEDLAGTADVRTGDGSIRLSGAPVGLKARSGDGSIVLRIRSGAAMTDDWSVTTGDGSISVTLPDNFSADIEADPGSDGRAHSDLRLVNLTGGTEEKPVLRGRLGQGGHQFVLRTGDGTIRLASR
jgi:hypothetical protein